MRLLLVGLLRTRCRSGRKTGALLLRVLRRHAAGRSVAARRLGLPRLRLAGRALRHAARLLRPRLRRLLMALGAGLSGLLLPRLLGPRARRPGRLLAARGVLRGRAAGRRPAGHARVGLLRAGGGRLARRAGVRLLRRRRRHLAAGGVLLVRVWLLGSGSLARRAGVRLLRHLATRRPRLRMRLLRSGRRRLAGPGEAGGRLGVPGVLRRRPAGRVGLLAAGGVLVRVGLLGSGGGRLARRARLRLVRGAGRHLAPGAPAGLLGVQGLLPAGRAVGGLLGLVGVLAGGCLRPRRSGLRSAAGVARLRSLRG
ncbi:hypothetical protein [Streptomonospora halophila]|uniref:hypothetical protein n=1 Tax=Streptomonospora halophila TaxID=427369 RepID=UPI0031E62FA3